MSSRITKREKWLAAFCTMLLFVVIFGGRGLRELEARESSKNDLFKELKVFTDVLAIVQRDYVEEATGEKLVEGAIKGMLATLDPHSGYLDPSFYQDLQVQTKGRFGGLGIEITIKDGLLIVVSPMEGSPAERAGIKAGDAIVKIEGKFTKEYSLVDAVKRLRGPKGTPINISIARKGVNKLLDVTIIRDNITVKSVRHRYLGDGFAYVRVSQFMEKTAADLRKSLEAMTAESKRDQLRGLILDMRNNPGGLLTQAIKVSDMFLKEGIVVYTEGRVESQRQKFYAHGRGTQPDYNIVVLINGGSASASEIVAGAMKDHGRAMLLGMPTFGKGSVQTITPLGNGGALTLTTALYYTKSGNSIQAKGVSPDIEMDVSETVQKDLADSKQERIRVRESDLEGAIKNPDGSEDGDAMRRINKTPVIGGAYTKVDPENENLADWLARDAQLQRALDLLRSFDIFQGSIQDKIKEEIAAQKS